MRVTAKAMQETDRDIRSAARKLFARRGLEGTSTRQIAKAAGIAVGTLFNYFPSKEALAMALAADAFGAGRVEAQQRSAARSASLEEDLFSLIACDIRALAEVRAFVGEVLEACLSPFGAAEALPAASAIRAVRLEDAAGALERHGLADAATPPVMHLYWSLYLGVLSYWAADESPNQEDTWALLDRTVRMFTGALRPAPTDPGANTSSEVTP